MTSHQHRPSDDKPVDEAAKTERHPEVPDHMTDKNDPAIPGGNRPDAAVAEDPARPGMIDKTKT